MAHEIHENDGAVFALTPAWHGLGKVLGHAFTSAEALIEANLGWQVEQRPLYLETWDAPETCKPAAYEPLLSHVANIRSDTKELLGVVGKDYSIIQNHEAFEFLDSLVEHEDIVYESAFSLRNGREVVLLARLPGVDLVTDGDPLHKYVLFSTAHDGSRALVFGPTSVRVVCNNTLRLAISGIERSRAVKSPESAALTIRHTGNLQDKLGDARRVLSLANEGFAQFAEISQTLAKAKLADNVWAEYLATVCPIPGKLDSDFSERRVKQIQSVREDIDVLYHDGPENNLEESARTAWAAYNAVSQYVDHLPRRGGDDRARLEARFRVTQFGSGHSTKAFAFLSACRAADVPLERAQVVGVAGALKN